MTCVGYYVIMSVLKISQTFLMRISVNANLGHLFSRSERTTKLLSASTASSVMSKIKHSALVQAGLVVKLRY